MFKIRKLRRSIFWIQAIELQTKKPQCIFYTSVLKLIGVLEVYEVIELLRYTLRIYLLVFYCIFMCLVIVGCHNK